MKSIKLKAHAKINIGYELISTRNDGFHKYNSYLVKIPIYDDVQVIKSNKFSINIKPEYKFGSGINSIEKAANVFKNYYCFNEINFDLEIEKHIRLDKGLGDWDSVNSAVILGMAKLNEYEFEFGELNNLTIPAGELVPFFSEAESAFIYGTSYNIDYLNIRLPFNILVCIPNFEYNYIEILKKIELNEINNSLKSIDYNQLSNKNFYIENHEELINGFEKFAFMDYPILEELKASIISSGAFFAQMSGLGKAIYGFYDNADTCRKAADKIKAENNCNCYLSIINEK